jgi:hypothetical protein
MLYYLKKNKVLIINKENWWVLDLKTKKKLKVDKDNYFQNLHQMLEY